MSAIYSFMSGYFKEEEKARRKEERVKEIAQRKADRLVSFRNTILYKRLYLLICGSI